MSCLSIKKLPCETAYEQQEGLNTQALKRSKQRGLSPDTCSRRQGSSMSPGKLNIPPSAPPKSFIQQDTISRSYTSSLEEEDKSQNQVLSKKAGDRPDRLASWSSTVQNAWEMSLSRSKQWKATKNRLDIGTRDIDKHHHL